MAVLPSMPPVAARCLAFSTSSGAKSGRGLLTYSGMLLEKISAGNGPALSTTPWRLSVIEGTSFARSSAMDSATRASVFANSGDRVLMATS